MYGIVYHICSLLYICRSQIECLLSREHVLLNLVRNTEHTELANKLFCANFSGSSASSVCMDNVCPSFYMHYIGALFSTSSAYGHTTLNAPVLVRSPKLSSVGPAQYLDG